MGRIIVSMSHDAREEDFSDVTKYSIRWQFNSGSIENVGGMGWSDWLDSEDLTQGQSYYGTFQAGVQGQVPPPWTPWTNEQMGGTFSWTDYMSDLAYRPGRTSSRCTRVERNGRAVFHPLAD